MAIRRVSKKRAKKERELSKNKAIVYERDGGRCQLCGCKGTVMHHIVFRSQGGGHDADNLVLLCDACHVPKAHGVEAKKYRRMFQEMIAAKKEHANDV